MSDHPDEFLRDVAEPAHGRDAAGEGGAAGAPKLFGLAHDASDGAAAATHDDALLTTSHLLSRLPAMDAEVQPVLGADADAYAEQRVDPKVEPKVGLGLTAEAEAALQAGADGHADADAGIEDRAAIGTMAAPARGERAPPSGGATLGARLGAARVALGLSQSDVASQLKVPVRKVAAFENDRWDEMPQHPYFRGFVRNYAKALAIDGEALLRELQERVTREAVPADLGPAPSLRTPFPQRRSVTSDSSVGRLLVWAAVLLVPVAGFIYWSGTPGFQKAESLIATFGNRPPAKASGASGADLADAGVPKEVALEPVAPLPDGASSTSGSSSSNTPGSTSSPTSGSTLGTTSGSTLGTTSGSTLGTTGGVPGGMAATLGASQADASRGAPAPAGTGPGAAVGASPVASGRAPVDSERLQPIASPSPALAQAAPLAAATPLAGQGALLINFRDDSWIEVRQADGKVLVSQLNHSGAQKVIDAAPPLELVIGNAPGVDVEYHGANVDLVPYTRERVARITLQ